MSCYEKIKKDIELRNKIMNLGIGCSVIGPRGLKGEKGDKGDQGERGEAGPVIASSNEGIFFADFPDINLSEEVEFGHYLTNQIILLN